MLVRAPLPLWHSSSHVRGWSRRLLAQCQQYFTLRCYLLQQMQMVICFTFGFCYFFRFQMFSVIFSVFYWSLVKNCISLQNETFTTDIQVFVKSVFLVDSIQSYSYREIFASNTFFTDYCFRMSCRSWTLRWKRWSKAKRTGCSTSGSWTNLSYFFKPRNRDSCWCWWSLLGLHVVCFV